MSSKKRRFLRHNHRKKKVSLMTWRMAGREEGVRRLLEKKDYHGRFTQGDLDFRMQKKGATLKEWKKYAAGQVRSFTREEKALVNWAMGVFINICLANGYDLPDLETVIFIKTTMREECMAAAYTHGREIYLGEELLTTGLSEDLACQEFFLCMIAHELFHCFTRSNRFFRAAMYDILGFHLMEDEVTFSHEIREKIINNPDVECHDSWAYFTIDGEKKRCGTVFTTRRPFEKVGDSFMDLMEVGLVPLDDPSLMYGAEDVADFWEVFGRNTDYVVGPEEVLADNFGYALIIGLQEDRYEDPRIIREILNRIRV